MSTKKLFQVSTLQALTLGYSKGVITVRELLRHGNTGLGTFENVEGEMITLDGHCYQADASGHVTEVDLGLYTPFCVIAPCSGETRIAFRDIQSIDQLKLELDIHVDEAFELNSMHMLRVDGFFEKIIARSEAGVQAHHLELKDLLKDRQTEFTFENIRGSLIAVRFPNYMDGINACGWHFHFISEDRTRGGHVFDISFSEAEGGIDAMHSIEILMPTGPAFDTYDMKRASERDIKEIEQGEQKQ